MNGLQIKPRWTPAIPKERRSFSAFFQCIFPQLAAFHWIYPDRIPFAGNDADFETLVESSCSQGYIPPNTLLPRFAGFVVEDSTDLFGFQDRPDAVTVRRLLEHSLTNYECMSQHTDICFFNMDGAWWEIYGRDKALLETVRQHVAGLSDITAQSTLLAERENLLRPRF